ncbi:hypothetical protein OROGR_004899 [Orobanche gracilis]
MSAAADEDWVKSAMSDDSMVVELLLRLNHKPLPPHPPPLLKRSALRLAWSVRQRRSKSVLANNNPKKPAHRGSPITPLSWSGATSFSAGSEESSQPMLLQHSDTTRSKVTIDNEKTNSKRSRKKKTLAELRDEENSLLKERRDLKKEMETLRLYLERQRATNGNLKRIMIELQPHSDKKTKPTSVPKESISSQLQPEVTASRSIPTAVPPVIQVNGITTPLRPPISDAKFILPDLNMPFDEPSSDVLCGISS